MLIDFGYIFSKYNMNITGILHVGAHRCEENVKYSQNGISNIVWVEGNKELVQEMSRTHFVLYGLIDERDGVDVKFNIASNGESSSILEFGTHSTEHPHVTFIESREQTTIRLDSLFEKHNISPNKFNFMNIDIQGKELAALKSMGDNLKYVDYIYTEVNEKELYTGCCFISDLDKFLKDFTRVETKMLHHGWGDALYIRKGLLPK